MIQSELPIVLQTCANEGWSERRVSALKQHHRLGLSGSESAVLLGVNRGAVCGKRDRLKLPKTGKSVHELRRQNAEAQRQGALGRSKTKSVPVQPTEIKMRSASEGARILVKLRGHPSLNGSDCRFPVGDISGADQLFCGEVVEGDKPYCPKCSKLAYQTPFVSNRDFIRGLRRVIK